MRNYLIYLLPFLLIAVSCDDEETVLPGFLSGEGGIYEISSDFCTLDVIQFEASGNWYVYVDYESSDENWIDVAPAMGEAGKYVLYATVERNLAEFPREADIVVKCSNSQIVYTIRQEAKEVEPVIIPEGGLDLIRSVKVENYASGNVPTGLSLVEFEYDDDDDCKMVFDKPFEYNRIVTKKRLNSHTKEDFSFVKNEESRILLLYR